MCHAAIHMLCLEIVAMRFCRLLQATKLIMAHMSKEPYEVTAWPLVVMAVQASSWWGGAC